MGTKNLIMSGLLASLSLFSAANAQLVGTKAIPGDYASLAAAITELNTLGVGAGGVTFNIADGYTETFTSPTAGLITATGTVDNPVIFKKAGNGTNPVITAGVGTTVTNSTSTPATVGIDGIIIVAGGDNFTFNGIDLKESDLNLDATTQMEFGYAILKASATDGAKNINITNCAVTLNKANTASKGIYAANHLASATTALTIADVAGINANLKINGCTISNCYVPINVVGFTTATTPVGAFYDTGLEIGTTSGNSLTNYGGLAVATNGIYTTGQNAPKIENNTITLPAGTTATSYGINVAAACNGYVKINANTVSVSYSGTTTQLCGISVATTIATPVDITNNIVQNCNYVTATTGVFYGIYEQSSTTACVININGNTLDGLNYSAPTLAGSGAVYAIYTKGNATTNVNNNIIKNYNKNGTGGGNLYGVYSFGSPTIENYNNNTIYNLIHAGAGSVSGIFANTTTGTRVVSGNTIYALASNGGAVSGLFQTSSSPNIFKNNIYNLTSTAALGSVSGITVAGGTAVNVYNNFISDLKTPAATGVNAVVGLNVTGGTTVGAYFNTIVLNAISSSVTTFGTSGIYVSATPTTVELKNNIVVNNSTGVGATGFTVAHRRGSTVLTNYAATSNTNLYYAGVPGVNNLIYYDGTNSDQTLAAYKARMVTRDQSAMTENVPFISATDLHINPAVATQVEGSASVVATPVAITDDFDGNLRSTTAPDIGADEGTFTPLDLNGPSITITNLGNTTSLVNRTLSNVLITDPSSVNATAGTKPRLYFRKSPLSTVNNTINDNTSATAGWKFVEANTTVSPFDFTVDYSLLPSGVVAINDTVQYFVVAQDMATTPNVSVASATLAVNPTSVALTAANFPATGSIRKYAILGFISGTFTVGAGQAYPTLTAAINDINSKEINGPVLLSLTDAEYATETLPMVINANLGSSAANTITIKPASGVQPVISGLSTAAGVLYLNGIDYVTIDGSNVVNGTSKDLTIKNTATTLNTYGIIFLSPAGDGAKNNTIKNCTVQCGSNTVATSGIFLNAAGGDFDNTTIENNNILQVQTGIQFVGVAGAISNDGKIINNTIGSATDANSVGKTGIIAAYCDNLQIKNNEVMGVVAGNTNFYQTGVLLSTATTNSLVSNNRIHDFYYTGTTGYGNHGIRIASATTMNNTVANNMIYAIKADGYNPTTAISDAPYGIFVNDAVNTKIYYNSINMTGATLNYASAISAGIGISSLSTGLDIRNNAISNSMALLPASTVTGVKTYGIYSAAPAASFTSINNNAYDITGVTPQIGFLAVDCPTIGDWQTATGKELNSASGMISFLTPTDLHLANDPALNSIIISKGQFVDGFATDYDGEARNATQPFIGCDENIALSINTAALPQHDQLSQNYPNPFNPETMIRFALANEAKINLTVYNAKGEVVQTLVNNNLKAGFHNVKFNALGFNSGVYFYKLSTPELTMTKKMLLVK